MGFRRNGNGRESAFRRNRNERELACRRNRNERESALDLGVELALRRIEMDWNRSRTWLRDV